jgi:SPP1 family predicted phage head-tail adaptor
MANCTPIKTKPFRVCTGDLKWPIVVNTRSITPPTNDSVDYEEVFTSPMTVYAMIETVYGETVFDGTNTEKVITHKFYIRYVSDLTFEEWVLFRDKYYDIINVENLNEENRFMLINANIRGTSSLDVNFS